MRVERHRVWRLASASLLSLADESPDAPEDQNDCGQTVDSPSKSLSWESASPCDQLASHGRTNKTTTRAPAYPTQMYRANEAHACGLQQSYRRFARHHRHRSADVIRAQVEALAAKAIVDRLAPASVETRATEQARGSKTARKRS